MSRVRHDRIAATRLMGPHSFTAVAVALFLITFGAGLFVWQLHFKGDLQSALNSDRTAANLLSELLSEHERTTIALLQSYASRPLFIRAVREKDSRSVLPHLTQLKDSSRKIDILFVTDKDGTLWVSYPGDPSPLGKNFSYRDWYKGVSKGWKPYISNVYRRAIGSRDLAVATCVPVFDDRGRPIGILATPQSLPFLASLIRQVPFDRHTDVTLIDHEGYIIYRSDLPSGVEPGLYSHSSLVRDGLRDKEYFIETIRSGKGEGKSYLTVAPLPGMGWTLVVERTRMDVLAANWGYTLATGGFSLLFFVLLLLSVLYIRKRLQLAETEELLDLEKKLREDEEKFGELFEHMSSGVAVYDAVDGGKDFIIHSFNAASEKIEHVSRTEVIGKRLLEAFPGAGDFGLFDVLSRVYRTGRAEEYPARFYTDGHISGWRENYVYKLATGEVVAIYDDVTERKVGEKRQEITNRILEALNRPNEIVLLTHHILLLLKEHIGAGAVGIRLREGEDYPYMETAGLSEDFVEKENHLCERDLEGMIVRDAAGNPTLECMCGNVILGRTDPSFPFFTKGGSFWTNSTTRLLASTTDEDRQTRTRNRCNGEGYESVALIPLKAGDKTVGLMQFNDRRPGLFSLDTIEFLEGIAASVGVAVLRKQAADLIRKSEENYRSIFENAVEGMFRTSPQGRILSANPAVARIHGYDTPEEMMALVTDTGRQLYVNPDDKERYKAVLQEKGEIKGFEAQYRRKDGSVFWGSMDARAARDATGKVLYYEGAIEDITSRKLAEEELTRTLEKLQKSLVGTIQAISLMVETRDPYTAGHQRRVSDLARAIAEEMGLPESTVDTIRMASLIHDIGKMSVPAEILSKPTRLTEMEYGLIKVHPASGFDILKGAELPYPVAEIVLQHHERLDGSGYPDGIKGGQILLEAEIVAVADVVEAIASHRPYRPAHGIDAALDEIKRHEGVLYNVEAVEACLRLFREKGFTLDQTRGSMSNLPAKEK